MRKDVIIRVEKGRQERERDKEKKKNVSVATDVSTRTCTHAVREREMQHTIPTNIGDLC